MVDSLHNLISAQQDNMIEDLTFADIAKPTASYVIDRRSTRVPFLAPQYSPEGGVSVARCVIADPGWLDVKSIYLVAQIRNTGTQPLVPLSPDLNGAFERGRLLSGQVIEDVLEHSRVAQIMHKLKPKWEQEEVRKMGFPLKVANGYTRGTRAP